MKEFMEKYGNDVLTQYKLPTEELEQLDQYDAEQIEDQMLSRGEGRDDGGDD